MHSGKCAFLALQTNQFRENFAGAAGGILYTDNITSISNTCSSDDDINVVKTECPAWSNNTVGPVGYGPGMAFPPASLNTSLPAEMTYVSNGNTKIPITAYALDQQGTPVTSGK